MAATAHHCVVVTVRLNFDFGSWKERALKMEADMSLPFSVEEIINYKRYMTAHWQLSALKSRDRCEDWFVCFLPGR